MEGAPSIKLCVTQREHSWCATWTIYLPEWHQLLCGQLRSGQVLPSETAVPPGPGGGYKSTNINFQRSNDPFL
jgi:hypothetical protein